tara:strand:+ start:2773 stop:3123 length:351 start_codon:yes stop_codon:yes gene_type:complete
MTNASDRDASQREAEHNYHARASAEEARGRARAAAERARRAAMADINTDPDTSSRMALECTHGAGNVWNGAELTEHFTVRGFAAPFVLVTRKSDGVDGVLAFRHRPRYYFNFVPSP